jgi:hypothetical protein
MVKTADEVLAILGKRFKDGRWAFRGHREANRSLDPTLERLQLPEGTSRETVEAKILYQFQRSAHHYIHNVPEDDDWLEWLALMQHYGSPTRLLDWTLSPYVAAFFASADPAAQDSESKPGKKLSAIWAIDLDALRLEASRSLKKAGWAEVGDIDWALDIDTPPKKEFGFWFFGHGRAPGLVPPFVAPVKPFRMNERLRIQQGIFLCPNNIEMPFVAILDSMLRDASRRGRKPWVYKLMFNTDARFEILRELRKMNTNYASLLPGLDGFAKSLKTDAETGNLPSSPPSSPAQGE